MRVYHCGGGDPDRQHVIGAEGLLIEKLWMELLINEN